MKINRGEMYWARLTSTEEHILGGYHLVVIVQADDANHIEGQRLTIVVPITSQVHKYRSGFDVMIPSGIAGLTQDSMAQCQQVRVLRIDRLCNPKDVIGEIRPIGTLPDTYMDQNEMNLIFLLGLSTSRARKDQP